MRPDSAAANSGLLLLRLYFGITIAGAGLDKLPTPEWMVQQVIDVGFPFPVLFAFVASWVEFAGGILIAVGLLTRPAALLVGFSMAVASFGFHGLLPLVDMHIAQGYVWACAALVGTGSGRYGLDAVQATWVSRLAPVAAASLLAFGIYLEASAPDAPVQQEEEVAITRVSVPGSFNGWDLTATPLAEVSPGVWQADVQFEREMPIEFKFAANESWTLNGGELDQSTTGFPLGGTLELSTDGEPGNIRGYIPEAGSYRLRVDLTSLTYSLDRTETLP